MPVFFAWLSIHNHDLCLENSTTLLCLYLFVYFEIVFLSSLETKLWFLVFTYKTKVCFKGVFLLICSRFFVMSLTSEVFFYIFPQLHCRRLLLVRRIELLFLKTIFWEWILLVILLVILASQHLSTSILWPLGRCITKLQ